MLPWRARHDREPHPHLHAPGRRRRDAPGRHEPGAEDASADRGLRDGRRAQRAARRRARAAGAARALRRASCAGSRTTCSTSAPTSPSRTAATARGCGSRPSRRRGSSGACDEVNAELAPLKSFVLPGGTPAAAQLHVCRTVCRRAERRTIDCGDDVEPRVRALPQPPLRPAVHPRPRGQRRRRAAVGAGPLSLTWRSPATASTAPSTAPSASSTRPRASSAGTGSGWPSASAAGRRPR